jgi:ketosteroid isomerase-like protein
MSTSDTEVGRNSLEIVRSFIATWNDHDINATMELLDPDIAFQSPLFSDPVRGIKVAGFFRVTREGKIAEERYYYDRLTLLQQLNPPTQS